MTKKNRDRKSAERRKRAPYYTALLGSCMNSFAPCVKWRFYHKRVERCIRELRRIQRASSYLRRFDWQLVHMETANMGTIVARGDSQ